jgi:hypothetical protein
MRRRLSGAPAVPFLKSYIVFNVEQIAGLPEHYYAKPGAKRPEPQRIEHAEPILRGDEGRHPPRRPTGLLFAGGGFHQEVLHHFVLWVVFWVLAAIWLSTQRGVL